MPSVKAFDDDEGGDPDPDPPAPPATPPPQAPSDPVGGFPGSDDGSTGNFSGSSSISFSELGTLSRESGLDRASGINDRFNSFNRADALFGSQASTVSSQVASTPPITADDTSHPSGHDGIVTVGVSYGSFVAAGIGAGADIGENWRPGNGLEGSTDAYLVAGPIISVPLPIALPTLNFGISAPPAIHRSIDPVDCTAIAMASTPFFSIQVGFDPATREFRTFTFSVTLALQIGLAGGMYCGFAVH